MPGRSPDRTRLSAGPTKDRQMVSAESTVVDPDVVYATPDEVEAYFEGSIIDTDSDPSVDTVKRKIANMSGYIDDTTDRAWRLRRVEGLTLTRGSNALQFSYQQRSPRHRRRSVRGMRGREHYNMGRRFRVQLPHLHVKTIDRSKGDSIEVLNPRSVDDITDDEGRADGRFVADYRNGVIRPDLDLVQLGATTLRGGQIPDDVGIRISYRYGNVDDPPTDADGDTVPDTVPGGIRDACAKLVASDLMDSDQYADFVPGGGGGVSIEAAAKAHKREAESILNDYRRDPSKRRRG